MPEEEQRDPAGGTGHVDLDTTGAMAGRAYARHARGRLRVEADPFLEQSPQGR